jgi:hypothetical protein
MGFVVVCLGCRSPLVFLTESLGFSPRKHRLFRGSCKRSHGFSQKGFVA